ncbi:hypothetical protein, partial [Acinetobacter sp. CFCC 10889]|uniref:hypothetical protein n=1 Tax=Acinetobacter sp. CFCC 10889 TaxID=1775557 RepID=UPI0013A6BE0D
MSNDKISFIQNNKNISIKIADIKTSFIEKNKILFVLKNGEMVEVDVLESFNLNIINENNQIVSFLNNQKMGDNDLLFFKKKLEELNETSDLSLYIGSGLGMGALLVGGALLSSSESNKIDSNKLSIISSNLSTNGSI